jgi:hypothetical protein
MFGKRKLEEQLKQNGQRATAKILTATQGRFAVTHGNPELVANTELTWHLTLEVMPDDAAAFEAELTDRWPQLAGPGIGAMIGVIYDPADHSKLVIDHSAAAAKEANARVAESVIEEGMRDHGASAEAAAKVGADAYLARTGAPGTGTVTAVHDTGVTGERDSHELEVTLDVTPDDGSAGYTAILVQLVGPMAMSRFEVGRQLRVAADPKDPTRVVQSRRH